MALKSAAVALVSACGGGETTPLILPGTAHDQTVLEVLAAPAHGSGSGETPPLTLPGTAHDQTVLEHLAGPAHGSGSGETTPFTLLGPAKNQTVVDHVSGSGEQVVGTGHAPVCPTDGKAGSTKTDQAALGQAKTVRVRRRKLGRNPSIDDGMATKLQKEVSQQPLRAEAMKDLDGLTDLASEHLQNFQKLIGTARSIVPPFKLRIGTACTGSSADLMSMVALQRAMDKAYPGSFSYEYIFNCEKTH